jgi:folate-binding protein YgfZ
MNLIWQNFIISQPISNIPGNNALYPITHLSILKVSGNDATQFLQGQLTCNVKELNENNSFFAGLCNPKGRVISTLLIFKQGDAFLLILPACLLDKVKTTLAKYILRSKVMLENASHDYGLSGFYCSGEMAIALALPKLIFTRRDPYLKLFNHYLLIDTLENSIKQWTELLSQNFQVQAAQSGQLLDLNAGLAWLDNTNSEEYIPQMLNLDKLGGISLTKGCYTGQEVVARTHYLGQVKREMFLAECVIDVIFTDDNTVIDQAGQTIGKVVSWQKDGNSCRLLVVMQTTVTEATELRLNNAKQDKISLIPFATI